MAKSRSILANPVHVPSELRLARRKLTEMTRIPGAEALADRVPAERLIASAESMKAHSPPGTARRPPSLTLIAERGTNGAWRQISVDRVFALVGEGVAAAAGPRASTSCATHGATKWFAHLRQLQDVAQAGSGGHHR